MRTIVFLDALTMGDIPGLESLNEFGTLMLYPETLPEQRLERCLEADVIITNKVVVDASLMNQLPRLKLICVAATGTNNIDLGRAAELNIPVKNVKGYSTGSVAQLTFGFIIELLNRISYYDDYVKSGMYAQQKLFTHIGPGLDEMSGKTIGIIGMGDIGKRVASIATAFQMNILYYSTSGKNTQTGYSCVSLDELLTSSDIVTIHAPLNENTRNLIRYKEFARMKPEAIFINTGRGGIVHEKDLVQALKDHIIAGAALDVFEKEPLLADSDLLTIKDKGRLLLTPHIAWASKQARLTLLDGIKANIREMFIDLV